MSTPRVTIVTRSANPVEQQPRTFNSLDWLLLVIGVLLFVSFLGTSHWNTLETINCSYINGGTSTGQLLSLWLMRLVGLLLFGTAVWFGVRRIK